MWTPFWDWFFGFTEFFSIVFGPVIIAALPIFLITSALLSAMLVILFVFVSFITFHKGIGQ